MKNIILIFLLVFSIRTYSQDIQEKAEQIISSAFSGKEVYTFSKYFIAKDVKSKVEKAAKQKFHSDNVYLYKITAENKKQYYGFIDNVPGKAMPITFMVILDKDGKIISTNILKYREQYGGQVQNENWNKKFQGKDKNSKFQPGDDVDKISGATISVNSVTTGIKKIVLLFNEIKSSL